MSSKEKPPLTIGVCELFRSLQGEGVNAGTPSVFLRTSGCNLRCIWCDTKYARRGKVMPLGDVISSIRTLSGGINHLVITGGEPMIWQTQVGAIAGDLPEFMIEVETNGTIPPVRAENIQYTVSPKLSNCGEPEEKRIILPVLEMYASMNSYFKFVVSSKEDIHEITRILERLKIPRDRVLLMPRGKDIHELRRYARIAWDLCLAYGFRYSPRLHIEVFGRSKRGV